MHIAETREQAKKNVRFGLKAFCDYFREIATFPIVPADVSDDCEWLIETGTAFIGTPDGAIEYIEKLLKGSGGFGVLMELAHNWADWDATRKHYELWRATYTRISRRVLPRASRPTRIRPRISRSSPRKRLRRLTLRSKSRPRVRRKGGPEVRSGC
jgi:hypothetical protein